MVCTTQYKLGGQLKSFAQGSETIIVYCKGHHDSAEFLVEAYEKKYLRTRYCIDKRDVCKGWWKIRDVEGTHTDGSTQYIMGISNDVVESYEEIPSGLFPVTFVTVESENMPI